MQRLKLLFVLSFILFANSSFAQESAATAQPAAPLTVSASVSDGGVRFAAPGQSLQMRLEIYNAGGELVFDSGARPGSILDWKLADAAQALTDGSYLSVVTVKDFQGKFKQRLGAISLQSGQISLNRLGADALTAVQNKALVASRQAQKIDASESGEVVIMREGKDRAVAVAAHDGQDAQVTSTKGAITFRTGDFFSNRAQEQMRITPEGRVGIGTDKPEATLDVTGTIRASEGIRFADGTVLKSAAGVGGVFGVAATGTSASAGGGTVTQSATGTGTQNQLARWADNAGTLGNSVITETATGNVGIGNANPTSKFSVTPTTGAELRFDGGSGGATPVLSVISTPTSTTTGGAAVLATGTGGSSYVFSDNLPFFIVKDTKSNVINNQLGNGTPLFTITPQGNAGFGTTTPQARLDVAGDIKLSATGGRITFPDGSFMTSAATGGGGGTPSGTSIVNAINDPATVGAIGDNRLSGNVARLNGANLWSGANVFGAGLSANNALVTNVGNPVNAGDAVNKAYTDANFIKFVPGAEQLSVGDANGTAPMINLRGGSTCCSGPGGHTPAFFKVFQNGSFVATGNLGIGVSPMQGKGYRTSWDSYKGAFRSGYADNEWDDATVGFFSWAGGSNSTAEGLYAFAFGDTNFARSTSSIAFGSGNEVKGAAGFSAGAGNRVCDTYGVAFGNKAQSGGPLINGKCATDTFIIRGLAAIAMGSNVTADQDHTTAMGRFATNNGFSGTFIWSDGSATAAADTFRNTANNEFAARATGGFRFRTNLGGTTGCNLPAGSGVFNCTSSRYTKQNFLAVNGEDVLARLRKVPVTTWNYISEGEKAKHMGPMAEDFYQAFGLGTGNTSIGVQDLAGVSLAAVKSLDERTTELQQKAAEVEKLRSEVNELRTANATLEQRLAALEQSMKANAAGQNAGDNNRR
ncbi:MAG TPA: tail fiber domain-containing protein [Pyrinomonadaceae bacterium]|nr:tail fiber domain-containing protein [Pyrinomonadaceae bacterium]